MKKIVLSIILFGTIPMVYAQLPRLILNEVYADFSVPVDYPLVKTKFNVYDPVGPTMEQFDKNVKIMNELNIETYRIELGWGRQYSGFNLHRMIDGTPKKLTYDFKPLDHMVTELKKQNVLMHGAYSYAPYPLQDTTVKEWRSSRAPTDMKKWREIIKTVAKHYVDIGIPFGVDEVWNEADGLYVFYSGTPDQFKDIYRNTVAPILEVNKDAYIAGPASAPELIWHQSFPEFVAKENLPMDAYTFHHYGSAALGLASIDKVSASLRRFEQLNTTAMILDEWHSADLIEPWCRNDDVRSTYEGAQQLLKDFSIFLTRPELTSLSWAWYMDPARAKATCMGLITNDGHRKAVFNAWKIYGNMPVDRKEVKILGPMEALASSDDHNASLVIWNPDAYQRRIDVHLDNVPFKKGDVRIYRIDTLHASYGDGGEENLVPVEEFKDVDIANFKYLDHIIPGHGTLYIQADDNSGISELKPVEVAKVVKVNRYYPARGKTTSYADFDRKTWIARLGMVNDESADQEIGVVADKLPESLTATISVEGTIKNIDANSLLGIRIDYEVKGIYIKSILFHGPVNGVDVFNHQRTAIFPWGTKKKADQIVNVGNLAAFRLPLKENAPTGWTGKAHIAFIMQNTGAGSRAKITLR